ncbi:zinc finger protein 574 [Diretmus argenteus]
MESSSSVYMCFPCYQEFNTLEDVLKHQLTCTAEVVEGQPVTSETTSFTVPLQQVIGRIIAPPRALVPQIQVQVQAEECPVSPYKSAPGQAVDGATVSLPSDQPRILYQCGDCDELFKSMDLWQQHRKECSISEIKSEYDPGPQTEQDPELEAEPEPGPDETGFSEKAPEEDQNQTTISTAEEKTQSQPVSERFSAQSSAQSSDPAVPDGASSSSNTEDSSPSKKRGSNKKPKPEPVLLCVDCGSSFSLVSELVTHRKLQHGLKEALHSCFICGESFLNTTLFLYHRKQHRQKGEEKQEVVLEEVPQEDCTQNNGTEEQSQDAIPSTTDSNSSFTQPQSFMCTQCGESFSNEVGLATHRKEKHGLQEALHHCSQCNQDFMNTTQYLYHRRLHRPKPGTEVEDGAETAVDEAATNPDDNPQSSKRLHSPSSESGMPQAKRGKPAIKIRSINALKESDGGAGTIKEQSEGSTATDSDTVNLPPPAKLLQDWARTPLPHVCPYCGKTFTRRVFLRTHVYSHTGEKLFTCKVCTKAFSNSQSLLRHSLSHTGTKPFNCDVCGKNFSQAATLKRHQHTHTSMVPRRKRGRKPTCTLDNEGAAHLFPCPHCSSRFNTEDQLNHHKLLHTSHPFPCTECGVAFKRRKELDLHSLAHQDKEPAQCAHCSAQFVNHSVLEIHMQRCPTTGDDKNVGRGRGQGRGRCTGQVECDLCGHRCMTQEGLDLHRLSHTGQTPLKCPVMPCRRRFASNAALEEHVLAHFQGTFNKAKNRPRFRCQICDKEFAYASTFNVHMRTHTDERPFECTTCGKRFRQLPHLQDHERIHSGLRPFCCWVCGKSFSVAARLTEHARTHSGEKPYPCAHCPSAFRSRSNLDKHIRLHGNMPAETSEDAQAAEAAQVQKVLEGAKVLTSLATTGDGDHGSVQTIYVLQGDAGTETVMIPSAQISTIEGSSQVVILPSSVLGTQSITVPTITMDGNEITVVEGGQTPQHSIEFIVEETV